MTNLVRWVMEAQANVERDYPVEVAELQDDDTNWHHGFNSGVVAAIRYMWDLMENGEEYADESRYTLIPDMGVVCNPT